MSLDPVTMDELAVINMYREESRSETVRKAIAAAAYTEPEEMGVMSSAIAKLTLMTEEEFQALDFSSCFLPEDFAEDNE